MGTLTQNGSVLVNDVSGTAFQVQNTAGSALLTADTAGMAVDVNGSALFEDPTNSTTAPQIENSFGNVLLAADTADMQITIGGNLIISGDITLDGHIVTGGSTPTVAADAAAACGGTATATVSGDDAASTVTVTTGSGGTCAAGDLATVTFSTAYGAAPPVTLTPDDAGTALLGSYNDESALSVNGFAIGSADTPTAATTYTWDYQVVQ